VSLYPGWTLDLIKKCTCTYTVHVNLIIHVVYYVQYIPVILPCMEVNIVPYGRMTMLILKFLFLDTIISLIY
jgi:hypothetical protein